MAAFGLWRDEEDLMNLADENTPERTETPACPGAGLLKSTTAINA
jgi:hypothetical protein